MADKRYLRISNPPGKSGRLHFSVISPPADGGDGYSPSVLSEMRVAIHVSQALSLNLTRNVPADYTSLTLAEGFYMATMGGAEGTQT